MPRYKRIELNIRAERLDGLIRSYLSGHAPTRQSAAMACSVSEATSGKVARALIDSGFMTERQFLCDGSRPAFHLFCRENANILLIDLSSSVFKMSIVSLYGEVKFSAALEYDPSLFPEENIELLLSRCGMRARSSRVGFCAISVIYADENSLSYLEGGSVPARLPRTSDQDYITRAVHSIFGKNPISHLTISGAICEALKFKAHGDTVTNNGISYVFIGNHISLFHIHNQGSVTVCSPQALIRDGERELLLGGMKKEEADSLFLKLSILMAATFSPSAIILESDTASPDEHTEELLLSKAAALGIAPPMIYYKNLGSSLSYIGAARSSLFSVIKRYIKSNID